MDCLSCFRSVYDTRVSLFSRPASLVSHFAFVRNPPTVLISSRFSWRISCEAIATKQSYLNPQVQENVQRRHNAMKHFLIQECCFSSSEITKLISINPSLFRRKSTDTVHRVLQMFEDCGFTGEQVRKTILRNPKILSRSDILLKRTIEYFRTLGIAEEDVNFIVSNHPRILSGSLDGCLAPKMLLLTKFFGSKDKLSKALRKVPRIGTCDPELMNSKLKALKNSGLLKHEIEQILEKDPRFLCASVDKIEKNMKFLRFTLGLKPNVVVKYPIFLNYSVEKRLRPRYKVFLYLNPLGARDDHSMRLINTLHISEDRFTERFVSGSPEVKMLYEKYKGKTVDVEVPEL